jgi:hypothetical protein
MAIRFINFNRVGPSAVPLVVAADVIFLSDHAHCHRKRLISFWSTPTLSFGS